MMLTWQVGSVTVTRIEEQIGIGSMPIERFMVGFDREALNRHVKWLAPNHYSPEHDRLISSIHSWVLRTDRHVILVDGCCGNHKERPWNERFHRLDTPWLDNLRAAGVEPEAIDIVLCTHLHADHVGWNTQLRDGRWVPTFPNAQYLFSDREDARWNPQRNAAIPPARRVLYEDSVLPVIEAGLARLIEGEHAIDDSLQVQPAPGHTPGQVVLRLDSNDKRGLFCADVLHSAIQVYEPSWNSAYCEDAEQARATRRRVLEQCAAENALLFPTHFGAPFVAAIRRTGEGFALDFVPAANA
jgi:glyoxylase-like metal-dependent hydrolase (beta-lactamase superfamily II)